MNNNPSNVLIPCLEDSLCDTRAGRFGLIDAPDAEMYVEPEPTAEQLEADELAFYQRNVNPRAVIELQAAANAAYCFALKNWPIREDFPQEFRALQKAIHANPFAAAR